ncbi:hypothetical protein AMBR_MGDJBKAP_00003 [Leuconostoc pseudomesenteroides]|nr:hypothetical protein AMBR_MGDJBKAP_00003 [Leuconostoc pseudomesenteroides]
MSTIFTISFFILIGLIYVFVRLKEIALTVFTSVVLLLHIITVIMFLSSTGAM